MLRAIRLENFRSFADSGRVEIGDLNVFIGPNSAGKTNLMTVIELAFRSMAPPWAGTRMMGVPSFPSFDSVVRHRDSRHNGRTSEFSLYAEWLSAPDPAIRWVRCSFREAPTTGQAFVNLGQYGEDGGVVRTIKTNPDAVNVSEIIDERPMAATLSPWSSTAIGADGSRKVVVVRPHRPVPRSVYVLDDPSMTTDDRDLIVDLLRIWSEKFGKAARERISESLKTMGLADEIDVLPIERTHGPQMVEVRVAPQAGGRTVTLADVGYGVSQALPLLLARDAEIPNGDFLIYQPEVHLHPRAQSRLADVFIASVERGNRVYVETHSEHLVLRCAMQGVDWIEVSTAHIGEAIREEVSVEPLFPADALRRLRGG